MRRKKSRRAKRASKRSRKNKDISPQTLMAMVVLVLVISLLSVGMYVYAFYGNTSSFQVQNSLSKTETVSQEQPAAGTASIEIIKPREER